METKTESEVWARDEFGHAWLGDVRRVRRWVTIAQGFAHTPGSSVCNVFVSAKERKAAYRFFEHTDIEPADVALAAQRACVRRSQNQTLLCVPIDGSRWTFTDRKDEKRIGPIGTRVHNARGLKVMTA